MHTVTTPDGSRMTVLDFRIDETLALPPVLSERPYTPPIANIMPPEPQKGSSNTMLMR